jgi:hypothetical protein
MHMGIPHYISYNLKVLLIDVMNAKTEELSRTLTLGTFNVIIMDLQNSHTD